MRRSRFCLGPPAAAFESAGEAVVDRLVHFLQRRLGDLDARDLLLGHRGQTREEVGLPVPGAGDELDLHLFPWTNRAERMAESGTVELHEELPVPRRSGRDSAAHPDGGGNVVRMLLAVPAQDFLQAVNLRVS